MTSGNFDGDTLKVFFNRIVNLEKDKRASAADFQAGINQAYGEAKDFGFTPKILRGLVAEQLAPKKDQEELDLEAIYRDALGLGGTPLGEAAKKAGKDNAEKKPAKKKKQPAAKGEEHIDPETGEVTEGKSGKAQEAGSAERATGKVRIAAEDLPEDPLEAAKVIALQASFGKIETRALDPDLGRLEVVKSKSAVGSVGEEMDDVHFALLEAGYHHVKGNTYAIPEHATEGV